MLRSPNHHGAVFWAATMLAAVALGLAVVEWAGFVRLRDTPFDNVFFTYALVGVVIAAFCVAAEILRRRRERAAPRLPELGQGETLPHEAWQAIRCHIHLPPVAAYTPIPYHHLSSELAARNMRALCAARPFTAPAHRSALEHQISLFSAATASTEGVWLHRREYRRLHAALWNLVRAHCTGVQSRRL